MLFCLAMITDKIDGDLARKHNLITNFGKIADPIADKAMTGMAFIGLAIIADFMPAWLWWTVTIVVLIREWAVTFARLSIAKDVVMPAKQSGKVKTVMQVGRARRVHRPVRPAHRRLRGARRHHLVALGGRARHRGGADDHVRAGSSRATSYGTVAERPRPRRAESG